jgi:hypothetical protein
VSGLKPDEEAELAFPPERPTRQSLEAVKLAEQEERLAQAAAREKSEVTNIATLDSIGHGTGWRRDADPSGVNAMPHGDRVAEIRDLYASGDTEAALALATELENAALATDDLLAGLVPEEGHALPREPEPYPVSGDPDLDAGLPLVGTRSQVPGELVPLASIVPRLLLSASELSRLPIDPRAGFLLSIVDGVHTMEEILDICAMPEREAIDLLEELRVMGVISL